MRAVGYFTPGPVTAPNSLMDIELPRPSATGLDLLVEVCAVSVNPVDYKVRASAAPPAETAKVIGYDAAGVVVEVGPQASLFRCCPHRRPRRPAVTLRDVNKIRTPATRRRPV